jgi:hypothetical protein
MNRFATKLFIYFFFLILAIPSIQGTFKIFSEPKLGGYVAEIPKPNFSIATILSGDFQEQAELFLIRTYGLRAYFIRIYNQMQFSLFKKAHADLTIIGKRNCLFGMGYINAHYGKTFIGSTQINKKVDQLKQIQDTLNRIGKDLLVVIASSKGTYYNEFIPDLLKVKVDTSNYEYYATQFLSKNVNSIDFNKCFLAWKDTCSFPLYPKLGVHWSEYGGFLATDSLLKYVDAKRAIDLPDIKLKSLTISKAKNGDIDYQDGMNLLFDIDNELYAYPVVTYNKIGKDSLRVLIVGDSFFYSMGSTNFLNEAFYHSEYWFYNLGVFKQDAFTADELQTFYKKVSQFDFIILVTQEGTMHSFSWRIIEDLHCCFFEKNFIIN